jgi:membrane protease YdiL (CAAX protease family)
MNNSNSFHKNSLIVYLLLAIGITWLCWLPGLIIGYQQGYMMPNFDTYHLLFESGFENTEHILLAILFFLGVYGPLIAGLVATWMDSGREGLSDLWRRIAKWRIERKWYLYALIITFLLAAVPAAIFGLLGGFTPSSQALFYILGLFLAQILRSGLGEEPGWRGFLLPRFKARTQGNKYIWKSGLVWSIWHYPIIIAQALNMMQDVTVPQMLIVILLQLAVNAMALIGLTYIYAWLYNNTLSVFLCIVFHALSNLFVFWFSSFLAAPQMAGLAIALMPWVVVIFMQRRLGKDRFPGPQPHPAD